MVPGRSPSTANAGIPRCGLASGNAGHAAATERPSGTTHGGAEPEGTFLAQCMAKTERLRQRIQHCTDRRPGIKPIRPEYLAATLSELADDHALLFFADTGSRSSGRHHASATV